MDALLVIDMQVGLLDADPKHDLAGVIARINRLAAHTRDRAGKVIFIQHSGVAGDDFAPDAPGWALLPDLQRETSDLVVGKSLNDPFTGTGLQTLLQEIVPDRVLVTGWATDLCVDATVRAAVAHDHHVVAVADGHTLSNRPHLDAASIIRHHNWVWSELITRKSIKVAAAHELMS